MNFLVRSPKALGNVIRNERKKLGLSQAALGKRVNLPQAAISFVENGHGALKLENMLALLAALDLDFQIMPRAKGSIQDFADMF